MSAAKIPVKEIETAPVFSGSDEDSDGSQMRSPTTRRKTNMYLYNPQKSLRIRAIDWPHIIAAYYLRHVIVLTLAFVFYRWLPQVTVIWSWMRSGFLDAAWWVQVSVASLTFKEIYLGVSLITTVLVIIAFVYLQLASMRTPVYCIDFAVAHPPEDWSVTKADVINIMNNTDRFNEQSNDFMGRILETSTLGEKTYYPPNLHMLKEKKTPNEDVFTAYKEATNMKSARDEAEKIIFPMIEELFARTSLRPKEIDFLIVNCSLFVPTPSLCAMICSKFGFRENILSYNLGGMGCSAGVISVDLAKHLLQTNPSGVALVVSTETITPNLYTGNERSMMIQNTLFRCGGAAVLLSGSSVVKGNYAKYKLLYSGRTMLMDEESYGCVFQQEDSEQQRGVCLDKNLVNVAGRALVKQFTQMAPHVLPMRELAHTIGSTVLAKFVYPRILHPMMPKTFPKTFKVYSPDFKQAIDHWCIHAGGKAVIAGIQKNLNLTEDHVAPSKHTLARYGNTSSSSIWYELRYIEDQEDLLHGGDRILQIAFGSGFKCNSAVWLRL